MFSSGLQSFIHFQSILSALFLHWLSGGIFCNLSYHIIQISRQHSIPGSWAAFWLGSGLRGLPAEWEPKQLLPHPRNKHCSRGSHGHALPQLGKVHASGAHCCHEVRGREGWCMGHRVCVCFIWDQFDWFVLKWLYFLLIFIVGDDIIYLFDTWTCLYIYFLLLLLIFFIYIYELKFIHTEHLGIIFFTLFCYYLSLNISINRLNCLTPHGWSLNSLAMVARLGARAVGLTDTKIQ